MTPEAQRIAIAEACGWKGITAIPFTKPVGYAPWRKRGWSEAVEKTEYNRLNTIPLDELPDYLSDLNACHEMEKVLSTDQGEQFVKHLYAIFERDYEAFGFAAGEPVVTTWFLLGATAAQRAEAFLRTIGKWEESK